MVVDRVDISSLVWDFLKTDTTAATVALRALFIVPTGCIYEAGDITPDLFNEREQTRREAVPQVMTKALALAVQDAGEDPARQFGDETIQYVTVRIYDRGRGYRNIRTVRDALLELLKDGFANLQTDKKRGLLRLAYTGRTGHRWDRFYNIEFEAISFTATVLHLDEEDTV